MKAVFYHQPKENYIEDITINELIKQAKAHKHKEVHVFHFTAEENNGKKLMDMGGCFHFDEIESDSIGELNFYSFVGKDVHLMFSKEYDELSEYAYGGNQEDVVYLMRFGELYLWIEME